MIINYEYPPVGGGAANATFYLGKALAALGHEVTVLTGDFKKFGVQPVCRGVNVQRVTAKRVQADRSNTVEMASFIWHAFLVLPRLLRASKPDGVIIFFSMPCGPLGLWIKFISGTPYVISLRGGDVPGTEPSLKLFHTLLLPIRRWVLKSAFDVIANSEGLKQLSELADPTPVKVIPNGVDTSFFQPPTTAQPKQPFTFLFVGRFQHQKNLFFLLDACVRLQEKMADSFRLVMVGNGPLFSELQQQVKQLALTDIVTLHNWADKQPLLRHYQNAGCLINPSLYEGMPNTVLEAMACGLPVIASNVAGNNSLVQHEQTGLLFELTDIEALLDAMYQVSSNTALASKMGRNARSLVEQQYSWEQVAHQYVNLWVKKSIGGLNAI